jgi:hypothetical protein
MNMSTEQMLGEALTLSQEILAAKSAWRNAWFADEGDILVMPVPMKQSFLSYIGDTLGFDSNSVVVISADKTGDDQLALTDERLISSTILTDLQRLIGRSDSWSIVPCYFTEGVAELASKLAIDKVAGRSFAAERGVDLLNRKTHFRQLAAGIDLPIAAGAVVQTPRALARAIRSLVPLTGTVILKRDNGAGNMGNLTITTGVSSPVPGSRETRRVSGDIDSMALELWKDLTNDWSHALVVESYHAAAHRFYFEYLIDEAGLVWFLNCGTIRLRVDSNPEATCLVWVGLDIPAKLPSTSFANAISLSTRFATTAAGMGYRGYINIDAIVAEGTNELIFNEVNARWGGCSVLHCVGERLLGPQYADNHVLSSVRNIQAPPLAEVLRILQGKNLQFMPDKKEGVLVLACDELLTNTMECLLIASDFDRVRIIEETLMDALPT